MIHYKSDQEIEVMKKGSVILSEVLKIVLANTRVGGRLDQLDELAKNEIEKRGAEPSFAKVKGYKWSICACVNDIVVHGIPNSYKIKNGDVVGIDCGVYYLGFHTDAAWTVRIENGELSRRLRDPAEAGKIENGKDEIDKFLKTGEDALKKAIVEVKVGNYIYDISKAIQETIEADGYSVVRTLVGHGVGRKLHEEPELPCFVSRKREDTKRIEEGLVLAIEVIYNMGSGEVKYRGDDGWTIVTKDGKISGLFEATVAATSHGCIVLTKLPI